MSKDTINITRKEYSDSCRKHYLLYKKTKDTESLNSRRLLLFYSAECGLKSLILKQIGKNTYLELQQYCDENGKRSYGHDIKRLTQDADMEQKYTLKTIRLYNGKEIQSRQFNELWRYSAKVADEKECEEAEETLRKIVEWLVVHI